MTYYWSLADEYFGFYEVHSAKTLKNALKNARDRLIETGSEEAVIFNAHPPADASSSRPPKSYLGSMYPNARGQNKTVYLYRKKIAGKPIRYGETYLVKADGSLTRW